MVNKTIFPSREEWLANRKNGIGGSEIASVMGLNPWMTNIDLWEIKTGRKAAEDISEKPHVKYGSEAEEHLRKLFELDYPQFEMWYESNNCFVNPKWPWAQASVDGLLMDQDGRRGIWECKTTTIHNQYQKNKWLDGIPENYYCQVLMYIAVLEADFAIVKAQIKHERQGVVSLRTHHYTIERKDVQDDIDLIMEKGEAFWKAVVTDKKPWLEIADL